MKICMQNETIVAWENSEKSSHALYKISSTLRTGAHLIEQGPWIGWAYSTGGRL